MAQVAPSTKKSFQLLFLVMSHDLHSTPSTLTSCSLFSTSPSLTGSDSRVITSGIHCADSRGLGSDGFTESEPRTSYEPNRVVDGINTIVTEHEIEQSTEESQIPEIEDKFSLRYNQSLLSSTQDSIESLAVPQQADLDDEQIRALLATTVFTGVRSKCRTIKTLREKVCCQVHFKV